MSNLTTPEDSQSMISYKLCMTDNKQGISTFKFGYPRLTLKEVSKVKSDQTKRFPAHDFL